MDDRTKAAGQAMDGKVKVVGRRRGLPTGAEAVRRAAILQHQLDLVHPHPRPRGFVFKAKTWEEYERWRGSQTNPRLW